MSSLCSRSCNLVKFSYDTGNQCFTEPECHEVSCGKRCQRLITKCNIMLQKCTTIQQQKCEDRALPQQVSDTCYDDDTTCHL